jgi:hypothetical protein
MGRLTADLGLSPFSASGVAALASAPAPRRRSASLFRCERAPETAT